MKTLLLFLVLTFSGARLFAQPTPTPPAEKPAFESPLGLPLTLTDLYFPGPEIQSIPRRDQSRSLVVRILAVKSAAEGHRYDLEVYGLDPGTYQLADFLQRKNGTPLTTPGPTVTITANHPPEVLPEPVPLDHRPPPKIGGYRRALIVIGVAWTTGLFFILFWKKRPMNPLVSSEEKIPLSARLSPLVEAAARSDLSPTQRAELDRLVLGYWREKFPGLALTDLRGHPEAAPLLLKMEQWLHSPDPTLTQDDLAPLLAPYRKEDS